MPATLVIAAGILLLGLAGFAPGSAAAPLILNEYNAVSSTRWLNGGDQLADASGGMAADTRLGRVQGNGGDWFELVVIEDGLDARGYRFELFDESSATPLATLVLSQDPLWASLRAGTLITIAEDQPTDTSYDPLAGDYWIAVQSNIGGNAQYISQSSFPVNNDGWQLVVRDAAGAPVFGPAGEGVSPSSGIGNDEVFRLEEDPSSVIVESSACYDDGSTSSSYGEPNSWSAGAKIQDFAALRAGLPPTSQCAGTDVSDFAFDPDRLLEIQITMAPADWDALRLTERRLLDTFGGACHLHPPTSPFQFFPADISVDGDVISNVGIRKKGFFGSLDRDKPSLKVDFSEFVPDQAWSSLDRLTLNNSKQDPSFADQCLGYSIFRDAGLPASRCNFAHVTVNGQDLGVYVNVESIKDPYLVRNFGNATGNLYEGAVSDFRDDYIGTFEPKNGGDGSDLAALKLALEAPDADLLAQLDPLIDVDRFLTYWAVEGLIGHWDGYASGANNFWVYNDPATSGFEFIPWGLDDIFGRGSVFSDSGPDLEIAPSVWDRSQLANRLWALPAMQVAYEARLQQLLSDVWDVAALHAEIDRIGVLIAPIEGDLSAEHTLTRQWIQDRATHVAEDFGASPPLSLGTPQPERLCLDAVGTFHAEFATTWDTLAVPAPQSEGTVALDIQIDPPLVPFLAGAVSGPADFSGTEFPTLRFITVALPLVVNAWTIEVPPDLYRVSSGPFPVPDSLANVISSVLDPLGTPIAIGIGLIADTTLTLDAASTSAGGPVDGTVDATLAFWVPEPGADWLGAAALLVLTTLRHQKRRRIPNDTR